MEASPSPLVRAATKPSAPVQKPKPTKAGMIAISPNVEQAKTQWDHMQSTGQPLYQNANFGGLNIPVNTVTGAPLSIDRKDMQARSLADAAVDSRLQARALSTPYKQHYGTGLGTGVAPINVMAEQQRNADREAEFAKLRAENREAFDRAKAMGMSPTTYKVGRNRSELEYAIQRGGEAGATAQRQLDAQDRIAEANQERRDIRGQRGVERGNAMAAAMQARQTGFLPTTGNYLQQVLSARDPRGAFQAQAEQAKVNAQAEALKANNLFKERELGLQEQEMKDNATFRQGQLANQGRQADAAIEHNKLLGEAARAEAAAKKLEAEAKASVLQQSSSILGMLPNLPPALQEDPRIIDAAQREIYGKAGISPAQSSGPSVPAAMASATRQSQYSGLTGRDLLEKASIPLTAAIGKSPEEMIQIAEQSGLNKESLSDMANYKPFNEYNPLGLMPFNFWRESQQQMRDRLKLQRSAKSLLEALGGGK